MSLLSPSTTGGLFYAEETMTIEHYITSHNKYIALIKPYSDRIGVLPLSQGEFGYMQFWYAHAQKYAYLIASEFRKMQKACEGRAEQEQANFYEKVRLGQYNDGLSTSTDAQYLSRRAKGEQLEAAAQYESDYLKWTGVAISYGNAINSIKDMMKAGRAEERGGVYE